MAKTTKTRTAPPALRRGTSATTGIAAGTRAARAATQGAEMVPVDQIAPNPTNPREADAAGTEAIAQLADSIGEVGVLQPVLLVTLQAWQAARPQADEFDAAVRWVVIAGNQRLAAAQKAGVDQIPAIVRDELATPEGTLSAIAAENGSRTPLSALAEAALFAELVEAGMSQRKIAKVRGCSSSHVTKRLKLLDLPDDATAQLGVGVDISAALALADIAAEHREAVWQEVARVQQARTADDTDPPRIDTDDVDDARDKVLRQKEAAIEVAAAVAKGAAEVDHITYADRLYRPEAELLDELAAAGVLQVMVDDWGAVLYGKSLTEEEKAEQARRKKERDQYSREQSTRAAEQRALEQQGRDLQQQAIEWLREQADRDLTDVRAVKIYAVDNTSYGVGRTLFALASALNVGGVSGDTPVHSWRSGLDDDAKVEVAGLLGLAYDLATATGAEYAGTEATAEAQDRVRALIDAPQDTTEQKTTKEDA